MRRWKNDVRGKVDISPGTVIHFVVEQDEHAIEGCYLHSKEFPFRRHRCVPGRITSIDADDRVNAVIFADEAVCAHMTPESMKMLLPSGIWINPDNRVAAFQDVFHRDLRWGGECDVGRIHLISECDQ